MGVRELERPTWVYSTALSAWLISGIAVLMSSKETKLFLFCPEPSGLWEEGLHPWCYFWPCSAPFWPCRISAIMNSHGRFLFFRLIGMEIETAEQLSWLLACFTALQVYCLGTSAGWAFCCSTLPGEDRQGCRFNSLTERRLTNHDVNLLKCMSGSLCICRVGQPSPAT